MNTITLNYREPSKIMVSETSEFGDLSEVVKAASDGKRVFWKHCGYAVQVWSNGPHIVSLSNNHAVGLYHTDGVTSDYTPSEFFTH